jgi:hypothetical protein
MAGAQSASRQCCTCMGTARSTASTNSTRSAGRSGTSLSRVKPVLTWRASLHCCTIPSHLGRARSQVSTVQTARLPRWPRTPEPHMNQHQACCWIRLCRQQYLSCYRAAQSSAAFAPPGKGPNNILASAHPHAACMYCAGSTKPVRQQF